MQELNHEGEDWEVDGAVHLGGGGRLPTQEVQIISSH